MIMRSDLSFVLRVVGDGQFRGTGVRVAPDRVLTCRHVVCERAPGTGEATDIVYEDLRVETDEGRAVAVKRAPLPDSAWDLALLEIEHPLPTPIPPLLWGITRALEAKLRAAELWVVGYAEVERQGPLWRHPVAEHFRLAAYREGSGILTQLQLSGGIPAGCSGGPVLLPLGDGWAYAGSVYLGGERAGTSRLIMADPVAEYLAQAGLADFARVDATRALTAYPLDERSAALLIERPETPLALPNPYRSLQAFRELDAPYFHGRAAESVALFEVVQSDPLITLVGASGSGKSSVVFAGLLPRLRKTGVWHIGSFRPKDDPFGELAGAMATRLYPALDALDRRKKRNQIRRDLTEQTLGFVDLVAAWAEAHTESCLLLIADQFEELYTQNVAEPLRRQFIAKLLELVHADQPCTLLVSVRADFLSQALRDGPFAEALDAHPKKILGPMSAQGLHTAIEEPARQLGVALEAGLAERIVHDLGDAPGNLPLLEFALTELWARQSQATLTHAAYETLGGVNEALAHYADAVLARFNVPEDELRWIFVQLVRPGEGTEDTRQVATREQIGEANWPLVKALADARLVVTSAEQDDGEQVATTTVEVVHEALIRHWGPLRAWMAEDRAFRTWQNRLREELKEWEEKGSDEGALLRGARLGEAEEQRTAHAEELSASEQRYIDASIEQREHEEQSRRQRRRVTVSGLVVGLMLALGLASWAIVERYHAIDAKTEAQANETVAERQTKEAEDAKIAAEESEAEALARQLAAQASLELNRKPTNVIKGALLATESLNRSQTLAGYRAWSQAMELLPRNIRRLVHEGDVRKLAFSPDGKYLATGTMYYGRRYLVFTTLWDVSTGMPLVQHRRDQDKYPGGGSRVLSPDGRLIAASGKTIVLRDLATDKVVHRLAQKDNTWKLAFSPDSRRLATFTLKKGVRVWDLTNGTLLFELTDQELAYNELKPQVAFTADGRYLVTIGSDETVNVWDAGTSQQIRRINHEGGVFGLAVSDNGRYLATLPEDDKVVQIWDLTTGKNVTDLRHNARVTNIGFLGRSSRLVTTSEDRFVRVWDAPSNKQLVAFDHGAAIYDLLTSPAGNFILTLDSVFHEKDDSDPWQVENAYLWDAATGKKLGRIPDVFWGGHTLSADGRRLAIMTDHNTVELWDVANARRLQRIEPEGDLNSASITPDGKQIVTIAYVEETYQRGEIHLWNAHTGEHIRRLGEDTSDVTALSFTPDGQHLIAGRGDGVIETWEVATGNELDRTPAQGTVGSLAYTSDGKRLIVVENNGRWRRRVKILDSGTWKAIATLGHDSGGGIKVWNLSRNGQRAATHGFGKTVKVWNTATGEEINTLYIGDEIAALTLGPDGKKIAVETKKERHALQILNATSGALIGRLHHDGKVPAIMNMNGTSLGFDFSPDGTRLAASVPQSHSIWIWNLDSGSITARLPYLDAPFPGFPGGRQIWRFSPGGRFLVTGGFFGSTARVWDAATGEQLSVLEHGTKGCRLQLQVSPTDNLAATTCGDKTVKLWDMRTGQILRRFPHEDRIEEMAFSPDGKQLATASRDWTARIWDIATGTELVRLALPKFLHINGVFSGLDFSPDGKYLLTRDLSGTSRLWSVKTGAQLWECHSRCSLKRVFQPKGNLIATSGGGTNVSLRDTTTGAELLTLPHLWTPWRIDFVPDSRIVLTSSRGRSVRGWNTGTGELEFTWSQDAPHIRVDEVAYSNESNRVATSTGSIARVWDTTTGKEIAEFAHDDEVEHFALTSDGKQLATVTEDGKQVQMWNVANGRRVFQVPERTPKGEGWGHNINALAFSPDGKYLATSPRDKTVRLWDAKTGEGRGLLSHENEVREIIFSPDSALLAAKSASQVWVWRLPSRKLLEQVPIGGSTGDSFALSPDGKQLATIDGQTLHLWEVVSAQAETKHLDLGYDALTVYAMPDGNHVVTRGFETDRKDDEIDVWDLDTGERQVQITLPDGFLGYHDVSPDGRRLAAAGLDNSVGIWDLSNVEQVDSFPIENGVASLFFSPDGARLVIETGNDAKNRISVWDLKSGTSTDLGIGANQVNSILFSPNGKMLATGEGSFEARPAPLSTQFRGVRFWDVATGRELGRLNHRNPVNEVVFAPDGDRVVTYDSSREGLQVWDIKKRARVARLSVGNQLYLPTLSPDGKQLAAVEGQGQKAIVVWDLDSARVINRWAPDKYIEFGPMYFDDDGSQLFAYHDDGVSLWEVATGRELARFPGRLAKRGFLPDRNQLITESDGVVRSWAWRAEDLIADACSRLERNLTKEEWRSYIGEEPYRRTCPELPMPTK